MAKISKDIGKQLANHNFEIKKINAKQDSDNDYGSGEYVMILVNMW